MLASIEAIYLTRILISQNGMPELEQEVEPDVVLDKMEEVKASFPRNDSELAPNVNKQF